MIGELDHVLASGKDVNILVLDTEGYSNTLVRYMVPPLTRALRDHLMLGYTVQPLPRRLDHGLIELVTALMPVFANRGSSLFQQRQKTLGILWRHDGIPHDPPLQRLPRC